MNNYHIYEEVGRGKYSVVYKGRKKKSIEYVAVKSVDRGRRKKFMDEVAIFQLIQNDHLQQQQKLQVAGDIASLQSNMAGVVSEISQGGSSPSGSSAQILSAVNNWHPNILKFHNWYETRNHFWIIFEYCVGGDLSSLLEQDKKLPEDTVKKFAYEILEGLSYLHSQGVIFGDLKPQNILMNEYQKLKLSDFGLSKKVTDISNIGLKNSAEERASSHSLANQSQKNKSGTPYYMAPELFQDNGVYSYQSDFWSLGCILIELATGKPPFLSATFKDMIQQIAVQDVPVIQNFSNEFNDFVQKILQKDPINRIMWDEIKKHPWWSTPVKSLSESDTNDSSNKSLSDQQKQGISQGGAGPFSFENLKSQTYQFTKRIYQPQLQFDKYLQNIRKIDPQNFYQFKQKGAVIKLAVAITQQEINETAQVNLKPQLTSRVQEQQQTQVSEQKGFNASIGNAVSNIVEKQHSIIDEDDEQKEMEAYSAHLQSRGKNTAARNHQNQNASFQPPQKVSSEERQPKIPNNSQQQNQQFVKNKIIQEKQQPINNAIKKQESTLKLIQTGSQQNQIDQIAEQIINIPSILNLKNQKVQILEKSDKKTPLKSLLTPDLALNNFEEKKKSTVVQQNLQQNTNSRSPLKKKKDSNSNSRTRENVHHQVRATSQQQNFHNQGQLQNKNQVKHNNFFQQRDSSNGQQKSQKRTTSPKPPHNPNITQPNFKNQTQQFFQNKTLAEIGFKQNINPQQKETEEQKKKKALTKLIKLENKQENLIQNIVSKNQAPIQSKNFDRFHFLNDQFDEFQDDGFQDIDTSQDPVPHSLPLKDEFRNNEQKFQFEYHEPMDPELTIQTLKMIIDSTLFNSVQSQQQIKTEIQQLISQTVQIGPIQTQPQNGPIQGALQTISTTLSSQQNQNINDFQNSNGIYTGSLQPTQMKVPHKTIEQLIIHNSDTAVKPIVGNKEIERIHDQPFNAQILKFTPWTSDEVIDKINSTQIESHLSDVYTSIASNTTISEKISTLQYFESIIVNSNVSNSLINSAFMALLKKMLEQMKSPMIKIRVCSVVGLLIRHSTIIDNDLAEIDIASQLIDTLRDSNELVRRRAIAALGEYMFYAATQLDDEMADPVWELSDDAIDIIVQSLDEQEPDHVVRFYACKTLENICAQSTSAGHRFATPSTVQYVLKIFLMEREEWPNISNQNSNFQGSQNQGQNGGLGQNQSSSFNIQDDQQTQNIEQDQPQDVQYQQYLQWYEGIRISSAIALSHICKLNPQLFPEIFETITPSRFCETLIHGNGQNRVQQAFITMLNLALHNIYYPQISQILLQEPLFFQALQKLLDHQHIVIRGKCILTFLLLFKIDFRWITAVQQEIKFFDELDKLLKDNYKYVQCCLLCLAEGIQDIVPTIFKTICEQLQICIENSKDIKKNQELQQQKLEIEEDDSNLDFIRKKNMQNYGDFSEIQKTQLFHINILLDLQINPLIRSRLLSTPCIKAIAAMIDTCDVNSFKGAPQFINSLFQFVENLIINPIILQILAQPIIQSLIPVLFNKLTNTVSNEIKSLSFKIYTDMMTLFLQNERVFKINKIMIQNQSDSQRQRISPLKQDRTGTQNNIILSPENSSDDDINQNLYTTQLLSQHFKMHLFPIIIFILTEFEDPIPMFGLKLLSQIAEKDPSVLTQIGSIQVANKQPNLKLILSRFYSLDTNRLNKNTINLIRIFIVQNQFTLQELQTLQIVFNTTQIIQSMQENQQEQSIEIIIDILHDILQRLNEEIKQNEQQIQQHIFEVFDSFQVCIKLLNSNYDYALVDKSSQCLIWMLQIFAQSQNKQRYIYFTEEHFHYLNFGLRCGSHNDAQDYDHKRKQQVQKRLLKCIYWALIQNENEYKIDLNRVDKRVVNEIDQWLFETIKQQQNQVQYAQKDKNFIQMCKEVYKLMKQRIEDVPKLNVQDGSPNINSGPVNAQNANSSRSNQAGYSQYSQYSQYGQR